MILDKHPDDYMKARGMKAIGYWLNSHHPDLPNPADYVDPSWNELERRAVAEYVRRGSTLASWRGLSPCRICGKPNGSQCLTDGAYVWPEGFAHYIEAHGVRPPNEFSKYVLDKILVDGLPGVEPGETELQRAARPAAGRAAWIRPIARIQTSLGTRPTRKM